MSLVQLVFILLGLMCLFTIIFFILLFQMFKMRKNLGKNILSFKHKSNQYKKLHKNSPNNTQTISTNTYHPAKFLRKIPVLNTIPIIIFLAAITFKASFYIVLVLLVLFSIVALLLPIYYLYLKKHAADFF